MICVEIYRPDEISKMKVEKEEIKEESSKSSKKTNSWRGSVRFQSENELYDPLVNLNA